MTDPTTPPAPLDLDALEAATVTREHRKIAFPFWNMAQRPEIVKGGAEYIETGAHADRFRFTQQIAQAIADAEARGSASLIAELRSLRAAGEWVACSERIPEATRRVLAYSPTRLEPFEAFHMPDFSPTHRWQYRNGSYCAEDEVTHWMPLPSPPVEGT